MKIRKFKTHDIFRSNPEEKVNYRDYRETLKHDFKGRCAYCNLRDGAITTSFHIDHFIPAKVFDGKRDDLNNEYSNLIYSCPKCNMSKHDKFEGDIYSENPTNELFYDPVLVDYNTIFYRNEVGTIASDDPKGQNMIKLLKLYRSIHILGWICDEMKMIREKLQFAIENEEDTEKIKLLGDAKNQINDKYCTYRDIFIASYNDKEFKIEDEKVPVNN